ncbi:MAG: OmpA family protein [Devosia sp.]
MRIHQTLVGTVAALAAVLSLGAAPASAQTDTAEINRIINELAPVYGTRAKAPAYRARIKTITVPVRPGISAEDKYVADTIIVERSYVLNYNHAEDFTVHFDFDSFEVTFAAKYILDVVGEALRDPRLANQRYLVAGHTDTVGTAEYNQWLSEKRANAVVNYLVETFGIDANRLVPVGFGEDNLADPQKGANRANRRVQVVLIEPDPLPPVVGEGPKVQPAPPTNVARTGNVVCDTAQVPLTDPRPAAHNLDDFGSPRTPVECQEEHLRTQDVVVVPGPEATTELDVSVESGQHSAAGGSPETAAETNAAIKN